MKYPRTDRQGVIYFISALVIGFIGYILSHPVSFGICREVYQFNETIGCLDNSVRNVGEPILIFSYFLTPISFLFVFRKESVKKWRLFALWWLPLSIILIALAPTTGGGMPPYGAITKELLAWSLGSLFAVISLLLIVATRSKV